MSERLVHDVLALIEHELDSAQEKFPRPQSSPHEGWAVLMEEVDELWDEVKANRGTDQSALKEAVQTGAMAVRYILEVCGSTEISVAMAEQKAKDYLAQGLRVRRQ